MQIAIRNVSQFAFAVLLVQTLDEPASWAAHQFRNLGVTHQRTVVSELISFAEKYFD
jgi:hypothetical protein